MKMKPTGILPTLLASLTLAAVQAEAGSPADVPGGPEERISLPSVGDWEFSLGLYGWAAGLDGTIGAAGFTMPVDLSFSEIFDSLDSSFMGLIEARRGDWMFQLEGFTLSNSLGGDAFGPLGNPIQARLNSDTTRLEGVIGYRAYDQGSTRIDLLAGAVYYDIQNTLGLLSPPGPMSVRSGDSWVDPVLGVRLDQSLGGKWNLSARGEIGGFGVQSDLLWQASALIGYRASERWSLHFGYRHAAVDYRSGGFVYDAAASGPLICLGIHW